MTNVQWDSKVKLLGGILVDAFWGYLKGIGGIGKNCLEGWKGYERLCRRIILSL